MLVVPVISTRKCFKVRVLLYKSRDSFYLSCSENNRDNKECFMGESANLPLLFSFESINLDLDQCFIFMDED